MVKVVKRKGLNNFVINAFRRIIYCGSEQQAQEVLMYGFSFGWNKGKVVDYFEALRFAKLMRNRKIDVNGFSHAVFAKLNYLHEHGVSVQADISFETGEIVFGNNPLFGAKMMVERDDLTGHKRVWYNMRVQITDKERVL